MNAHNGGEETPVNEWDALVMTDYFRDNVLLKRPYIQASWCRAALTESIRREIQPEDGRIRHWIFIESLGKFLRVVTLADGVTLHNAFPDRRFHP